MRAVDIRLESLKKAESEQERGGWGRIDFEQGKLMNA